MPTDISAISRALTRPGAVVFAMLFLFDSMARSLLSGAPVVGYDAAQELVSAMPVGGRRGAAASLFVWFLHHVAALALHGGGDSLARRPFILSGAAAAAGLFMRPSRRPAQGLLNLCIIHARRRIWRGRSRCAPSPASPGRAGRCWASCCSTMFQLMPFGLSAFCVLPAAGHLYAAGIRRRRYLGPAAG
jgi:hypothetical protein